MGEFRFHHCEFSLVFRIVAFSLGSTLGLSRRLAARTIQRHSQQHENFEGEGGGKPGQPRAATVSQAVCASVPLAASPMHAVKRPAAMDERASSGPLDSHYNAASGLFTRMRAVFTGAQEATGVAGYTRAKELTRRASA